MFKKVHTQQNFCAHMLQKIRGNIYIDLFFCGLTPEFVVIHAIVELKTFFFFSVSIPEFVELREYILIRRLFSFFRYLPQKKKVLCPPKFVYASPPPSHAILTPGLA